MKISSEGISSKDLIFSDTKRLTVDSVLFNKFQILHRKFIECIYHIANHPLTIISSLLKIISSATQTVSKKKNSTHNREICIVDNLRCSNQSINRSKRINTINRSQVALEALSQSIYNYNSCNKHRKIYICSQTISQRCRPSEHSVAKQCRHNSTL